MFEISSPTMKATRLFLFGIVSLLAFSAPFRASAQTTLITTGAVWKYLDNGSDQGTAWTATAFVDTGWSNGVAQFGYGEADETTLLAVTNLSGTTNITFYFRHTFNLVSAASVTNLRARLQRDDGVLVFLNGMEVFRDNMPTGAVTFATNAAATASDDGQTFNPFSIPAGLLTDGPNAIAVEVHQASITSSDVSFDFELIGNPQPSITISSPTNSQVVIGTSLAVNGVAVPGGTNVTLVEVYTNAVKLGESTNAAYSVVWSGAAPGNYSLTARVLDSSGLRATSAPVAITIQAPPVGLLVARGSVWKYNDLNTDLSATTWRTSAYNDASWLSGPGPLGGGDPHIVTTVNFGPSGARYPTVYYRRTFNVSSATAYSSLTLRLLRDDGAAVYLNGTLLVADGTTGSASFATFATQTVDAANESAYFESTVSASALVEGLNVLAVENKQINVTSSDLGFDLEVEGTIDNTAPTLQGADPSPGSTVLSLGFVRVVFSEGVNGVNTTDLLINNEPATNMIVINPREYTFYFPPPPTGTVQVAFIQNHGITDASPLANAFGGGSWTYTLDPNVAVGSAVISEFLTDNAHGAEDEDGSRPDWVELYNPTTLDLNMDGWFLTDSSSNLTKWRLPAVNLGANKYLLIWASTKNRTNPAAPLHTNFELSSGGGYLALVNSSTNVVSAFNPYPVQGPDNSYGRDRVDLNLLGYFILPTPGAQNSTNGPGFSPQIIFSHTNGIYTDNSLSVTLSAPGSDSIRYTVDGSEPTASSTLYSSPITIAGCVPLKARSFKTFLWPSAVGSRTFVLLDSTTAGFSSDIPILVISAPGTIPSSVAPGGTRRRGMVAVVDTFRGRAALTGKTDFLGLAQFETFGQTSEGFPKKPHNIEINDNLGNDSETSLLGLPAEADWKLRNPYSDKCLMNDFLAYELFDQMGNYSCRRRFVEVFRNETANKLNYARDYYGVLVLLEKIERGKDRVNIAELQPGDTNEPAISGGYMFKRDKASTGDLDFSTTAGTSLKLHEPKPREVNNSVNHPQVLWLRNYLSQYETAVNAADWTTRTGTNHYSNYIDVDSFVDSHWIVEFAKQIDGYRISNFFSKDRNGKVRNVPIWDWNLAFGNGNYLDGGHTNQWYYPQLGAGDHLWLRRLVGASPLPNSGGDPDFIQKVIDRWGVLRTNVMNGARLGARIDQIGSLLGESAGRNFTKYVYLDAYQWPNPDGLRNGDASNAATTTQQRNWDVDYQQPTYAAIISEMKKWTVGRYLWIDEQFPKAPTFSLSEGNIAAGTSLGITAPAGTIFYTTDGTDPRQAQANGAVAAGAVTYVAPATLNANVRVFARARNGTVWSPPTIATFVVQTPPVVITEVMYHPPPPAAGSTNVDEDFEFIELKNKGASAVNLQGFRLRGGVDVTLSNYVLAAGSYVVVVAQTNAFRARYGNIPVIVGSYTNRLQNGGEHIVLEGPVREPIHDFTYSDGWYDITDGLGFSLVPVNEALAPSNWVSSASWRASSALHGSPGTNDAVPVFAQVVINEALTHSDPPLIDALELRNFGGSPADISHWYLTDDFNAPQKYRFPSNSIVPASGYLVVYETNFNSGSNAFSLSSLGDAVYLFSGNAAGNLTGYEHGFDFGAQFNGVTFGRYVTSQGEDHFVAQSSSTLGSANAGPLVGPVIITEINYHPPDVMNSYGAFDNTEDEYIELKNISGSPVQLHHPTNSTLVWTLRDAVDYAFPAGTTLPAGGYALVVSFDPVNTAALAAFKATNGVPDGIPIFGPFSGKLDNSSDSVELTRPDNPEQGITPQVLVDKVHYTHLDPWPAGADGLGFTLQRLVESSYGNDATNWNATVRSPGYAFGGAGPVVTVQPQSISILATFTASLSITVTGAPPITYQWYYNNNTLITGATNSNLSLPNVQPSQSGLYRCLARNAGGATFSSNATLNVVVAASLTQQPANVFTYAQPDPLATNRVVVFTVQATTQNGPLTYRWRNFGTNLPLNNTNLTGVTSNVLTISNLVFSDAGYYSCALTDQAGTIFSTQAILGIKPFLIIPPTSQTIPAGGNISVGAAIQAFPGPFFFKWYRGSAALVGQEYFTTSLTNFATFGSTTNSFVLTAQSNLVNAYDIRLSVTNLGTLATPTPYLSNFPSFGPTLKTFLIVLDSDGDGIPDQTETNLFGMDTNNPADALGDLDGDGMSNLAEFRAGTNPTNAASFLRIELTPTNGLARLEFVALSNRLYTVQFTDTVSNAMPAAAWSRLVDFLSRPTNRVENYSDPNWTSNRFYRAVTPRAP